MMKIIMVVVILLTLVLEMMMMMMKIMMKADLPVTGSCTVRHSRPPTDMFANFT